MDEFWRQALQPALRIWRHGESLRCEPNAAARQWALEQGLDEAAQALAWQALAPRVLAAPDAQRRAWQLAPDLGAREGPAFEAQALACADGALLAWLPPTTAPVGVLSALDAGGVGVWRRAFGQGSFWSEAMYRLRGLSRADPRSPDELAMICLHPEDRAQWQQMVQRYAQRPPAPGVREAHEWEFRVVWPDGSVHWLVSRGRTVCDEQGRPAYMTGVNLDVTERRKAQALTLENGRLAQIKRTQSEFLARVSHELRTPMNAVLGFAQLMSYDTAEPLSPRQSERLARIDEAGRHLLALIDDVLDLARIDADRQTLVDEPVPLDALVREALGYSQDRGDSIKVISAPFVLDKPTEVDVPLWKQPWLIDLLRSAAVPLALVLVALIAVFGLVRPAIRAARPPEPDPAAAAAEAEAGKQLDAVVDDAHELPGGLPALEAPASNDKLERARQLARENPVAVANIMRSWIHGEDEA